MSFKSTLVKLTSSFIPSRWRHGFSGINRQIYLGTRVSVWIDVKNQWDIYCSIPQVSNVINKKSLMFSNMRIKLFDQNGKEIENDEGLNLLTNPNPIQNQKEWLMQYMLFKSLTGNDFIYLLKGGLANIVPEGLWNLPSSEIKVNLTGKLFNQTKIEKIIENYELLGTNIKYKPQEVIHKNNGNSKDYVTGANPLEPLQKSISNIAGSLETRNVLLYEKGGIGILASDSGGEFGGIPMDATERSRVDKAYNEQYGIGRNEMGHKKSSILITERSVKWVPMTFPVKDLMLFEEVEDDFQDILDAFGMAREIFASLKGTKFENQKEAKKATYQDTLQPEADDLMNSLSLAFGYTEKGWRLEASYSHLPVMQMDMKLKSQALKQTVDALSTALTDDAITIEEYKAALEKLNILA